MKKLFLAAIITILLLSSCEDISDYLGRSRNNYSASAKSKKSAAGLGYLFKGKKTSIFKRTTHSKSSSKK